MKQKYLLIENYCSKSEVVSHTITDIDVFTIADDDTRSHAFINFMHVRNGAVNQSFTFEYKRKLDETDEELLITAILKFVRGLKAKQKKLSCPSRWSGTSKMPCSSCHNEATRSTYSNCRR